MKLISKDSPETKALAYCRTLTDEEWKRFKRAVDAYRKADRVLSGEDVDGDITDIADQIIET